MKFSPEHILSEVWIRIQEAWAWILNITGLTWWEIVGIIILLSLFQTFYGGSGKGRGRRYRRGYSVAYREERGKLAARRAERKKDVKGESS